MILNRLVILLIGVYQQILSPQTGLFRFLYRTPIGSLTPGVPSGCRFSPTCSEYAKENFIKHPFFTALKNSLRRLGQCHNL